MSLFSQYGIDHNGLMVIDSDGVQMRQGPGIEYDIVKGIPFGGTLTFPETAKSSKAETIDGLEGAWMYLKYQSYEGFVFNAFLSSNAQSYNSNYPKGSPQFFYPSLGCGSYLFFNKDLQWHAVVDNKYNKSRFDIVPVNIEFQISSESGVALEAEPELYINQYLSIKYEPEIEPRFLLGLPKRIKTQDLYKGRIPIKRIAGRIQNRSLLPGDVIELGLSYKLYCFGSFDETSTEVIDHNGTMNFKKYAVKIASDKTGEVTYQELDISPSDVITFIGDLNYDSVMDIIVQTTPGWSETYTKLYLSGHGVKTFKEVAGNYWGSCY